MGVPDRRALDELARSDPGSFWEGAGRWLGLTWEGHPRRAFDPWPPPRGRWFGGGQVDAAHNLLGRWLIDRRSEVAVSWEREDGDTGQLTFEALDREVARVASGLSDLGVGRGDRVAMQLPMSPEAVITMLATARLAATLVPLYTGFGAPALLQRIERSGARVFIGTAGFRRRGRWIDGPVRANDLDASVSAGLAMVVVSTESPHEDPGTGRVRWEALGGGGVPAAAFDAEDPLLIAYTSGTTGPPKGVALGAAGTLLKMGTDAAWLFDVGAGERATWITDPGWIMGPIIIYGALMAGGTLALYDGAPDWPDPERMWHFVHDHDVAMLGVSPTLVRGLMAHPEPAFALLASVRVLAASGEPWDPEAFAWLFARVGGGRIPIINYSGGTEVGGAILSNTVDEPVANGVFAGPVPGMGADVVDAAGRSVEGVVGDLVLAHSSPAMATTFWDDHPRYLETYWSQLPGRWWHGDWVTVRSDGTWQIHGRSDDTIKVAGRRIGPAEVEAIVNLHPDVRESAAVSLPDTRTGESLIVFAGMDTVPASTDDRADIESAIIDLVVTHMGRPFRPGRVILTPSLPKTRSGKIMRRLVRGIARGEADLGDLAALDDLAAIDATRQALDDRSQRS